MEITGEEIINPGAVPESPSFKDYRFEFVAGAEPLPEEYSLRDKIFWIKSQRSSSCVAQSFSYYAELLNFLETGKDVKLSARDIYSVIYLPEGGAYLRSGAQKVKDSGVVLEEDAPSYLAGRIPLTESEMRKRDDITEEEVRKGKTFLAKSYVRIPARSFEALKRAIYEYHGAVTGIIGDAKSWFWDVGKDGIVDLPKKREFGHAIFCVHPDTAIITRQGIKKIKDIKVGEQVLTHLGRWKRVKKVMRRYVEEKINIIKTRKQIKPLIITDEHPVYIDKMTKWSKWKQDGVVRKKHFDWVEAKDIEKYNVGLSVIPSLKNKKIEKIDGEFAYLLGLYIADGNLKREIKTKNGYAAVRFCLNREADEKVMNKIIKIFFKKYKLLPHFYFSKRGKDIHVTFYSVKLTKLFKEFGGEPNNKNISSDFILGANKDILKEFISGWIDGDGCKIKGGRKYSGFTSSERLAYQIKVILQRCRIPYSVSRYKGNDRSFPNSKGGYVFAFPISERHSHYWKGYEIDRIKEIKKEKYAGYVYNLEVEDDNSYVAEGLVVHNCLGWKKINGKEYIEFVNSFGPDWGDNGFGYLPKEYFDKNLVFNPWTLIDMPNEYYSTLLKTTGVLKRLIVAIRVLLEKLTKRSLIKT